MTSQREKARKLVDQGLNYETVAKKLGVSVHKLQTLLDEPGLGLCVRCGIVDRVPGRVLCELCRIEAAEIRERFRKEMRATDAAASRSSKKVN